MLHIYNLTPNTGQLVYLWGKSSRSGWDIKFRNSMPKFRPWRLRSKQHPFPELQSKAYNVILLCTSVFFFQVFLVHEIILSWIYMHRSVFPNRKVNLFCIWCEYVIYIYIWPSVLLGWGSMCACLALWRSDWICESIQGWSLDFSYGDMHVGGLVKCLFNEPCIKYICTQYSTWVHVDVSNPTLYPRPRGPINIL